MGAGAHCDALSVDDGCDIVGMGALQIEGNHRALALRCADQPQRIELAKTLLRIFDKTMLVRGDALLADRVDVVDGGTQPDRLDDRGGGGLGFVWRRALMEPL